MILIRPEEENTMYTRVFLKNEKLQDSKTAEQFLMAYGLNGTVVDSGFLISAARMLLLIFPGIVMGILFLKANRERRICRKEQAAAFWMWTGACVLIVAAAAVLLWKNMEIPQEWIPSRWSDFQFWSDKFRELEEKVRLFLMLPKTVGQAENILEFVKCAGCSMGSAFIGILALLSKRERSKRTSA